MSVQTLELATVRSRGMKALARELGPAGMVQFMQQFRSGYGDYTKERHKILGKVTVDGLMAEIRSMRRNAKTRS